MARTIVSVFTSVAGLLFTVCVSLASCSSRDVPSLTDQPPTSKAGAAVRTGAASAPSAVALTVYNNDLALIRETRNFNLDGGTQALTLSDVSGMLRPESVHLSFGDGTQFNLLEQNYDYDLVSTDNLLKRFIGRKLDLVDSARGTRQTVTLLNGTAGHQPYELADGILHGATGERVVQAQDGTILVNPPGRIELPADAAKGLLLRPTLSWLLESPAQGQHAGEISYLSGGLGWSADYVLMLSADDKHAGIEGWVTLSNNSGTTYKNATLKLVAGVVNQVGAQTNSSYDAKYREATRGAVEYQKSFQEEPLYEYHLYDLQRPTTINNNQQKQIGLLTATSVPVKKVYRFDGFSGGEIRVVVQFKNDEKSGLGMPLPAGVVRLFKADSKGQAQFVGEDQIDHTPKDEAVRLATGTAFDVKGEALRTAYHDLGKGYSAAYKVTLKNHKADEDIVVTVSVNPNAYSEWQIIASNYGYTMKDASTAEFQVLVKAGGEAELTYSFKVVWR